MNIARRAWRKWTNLRRLHALAGDADAFLVSFPKSGRTWFRFILSNYFNLTLSLGEKVSLHSTFKILPNFALDESRGIGAFAYGAKRPGLPLILVSHLDHGAFLFRTKPVIFMVRDPRDVLVSAYFHATLHKRRFTGDLDSFLRSPEHGVPQLCRYLNGWAAGLRHRPNFILGYERLQADPIAQSSAALRFLGCSVNAAAVAEAVNASRFDAMRELELAEGLPDHEYDRSGAESLRMRRGKAGGFVDYLNADQIADVESELTRRLSGKAKAIIRETGLNLA